MKVAKDSRILDVVHLFPDAANVFERFNMGCSKCAVARLETIEEGALVHGIDVDLLVTALNKMIKDSIK